jgi:hypothetical protein
MQSIHTHHGIRHCSVGALTRILCAAVGTNLFMDREMSELVSQ